MWKCAIEIRNRAAQAHAIDFMEELRDYLSADGEWTSEPDRRHIVEFIRMGGWQANSNEPNFYHDYTDPTVKNTAQCFPCNEWKTAVKTALIADLQAKGVAYDFEGEPVLDDVSAYANAQKAMLDSWKYAFGGTGIPLSTTVNLRLRPCTADSEFLMYSLTNDMILLNPGLNEKRKKMTRDFYYEWTEAGAVAGWGGVKFDPPPPNGNNDYTRIGAAFQGFGWKGTSTLPDCIANSTNPLWVQYREATTPIPTPSYAIFGTNFLGTGENFAFNCAREIIEAFTQSGP